MSNWPFDPLRPMAYGAIMSAPPGALVDHKNGDGLDNRRANLRFASASQNNSNSRIRASNSTGFKGVTFDRGRQKWRAQISVGGRVINLGRYETPEDAHAAYAQSAQKHYGEFARLA